MLTLSSDYSKYMMYTSCTVVIRNLRERLVIRRNNCRAVLFPAERQTSVRQTEPTKVHFFFKSTTTLSQPTESTQVQVSHEADLNSAYTSTVIRATN